MIYRILILLIISTPLFSQNAGEEINRVDKKGQKQGKWVKYYPDSEVKRYEGTFKDDQPVGEFTYYYPKGEQRSVLTHLKDGKSRVRNYYPDGTLMAIGVYKDTLRDSTWTFYSPYGEKLSVESYIVGKKYGKSLKFHKNGQVLEELYWENDLENGPYKEYFENGIISREGTYVNGALEGPHTFYHSNGEVQFTGEYHKDVKEGIWKTYNDKGELTDERKYTKGRPEFRESDLLMEDSTKYYRKDKLDISDFIEEDYMAIPEEEGKNKKKK